MSMTVEKVLGESGEMRDAGERRGRCHQRDIES